MPPVLSTEPSSAISDPLWPRATLTPPCITCIGGAFGILHESVHSSIVQERRYSNSNFNRSLAKSTKALLLEFVARVAKSLICRIAPSRHCGPFGICQDQGIAFPPLGK